MAKETLSTALALMFGHEGGYVNAKTDRGGPTCKLVVQSMV